MTGSEADTLSASRSRIVRNAVWYLAAGLGGHAYVLISLPMLQRALSPSEFGTYVILSQVVMILQMVTTALFGSAIFRLRVEYEGEAQKSFLTTMLGTAMAIQLGVWVLLAWQGGPILRALYPNLTTDLGSIPTLLGAWALLLTLRTLTTTLIKSLEEPGHVLLLNILYGVMLVILLWVMLLRPSASSASLVDAFWALLMAEGTVAIVIVYLLRRHLTLWLNMRYVRAALAFTGPLVVSSILLALVLNLDGMVLARYVDLETQGIYGLGAVLGKASAAVVTAYISSYSARLINSLGNQPVAVTTALLRSIMVDNLVLLGAFTCIFLLSAEAIIAIMASDSGSQAPSTGLAVWALAALGVGNLCRSVFQVFSNTLFALKRTSLILGLNAVLLIVTGAVMVAGAEVSGAAGVAAGMAISYVILSFLAAVPARATHDWVFPWGLAVRTAGAVGASLAGTAVIWQLGLTMSNAEFWGVKAAQVAIILTWLPELRSIVQSTMSSRSKGQVKQQ